MKKRLTLLSITFLMAQDPISFTGESEPFELDGIAPAIEWLSPQSDEYFDSGETILVNWNAFDESFPVAPIEINLLSTAGEILTQWGNIENTGSIDLTLPDLNFTNAKFTIAATDSYGNYSADNGDGDIHIGFVDPISFSGESNAFVLDGVAPNAMLISPNGGEAYIVGEIIPVSWSASDDSPENGEASLYISTDGSQNYELVESGLSFSGSTNTITPDIITQNASFQIQVTDYFGNTATDESDNTFSIIPIPDIIFNALSGSFILDSIDPLVNWLFPNGGEVLQANWPVAVSWSASDDSFADTPIEISWSASDIGIDNELLASDVENSGTLNITMPDVSSDGVYFHIQAVDDFGNSNSDDSDEPSAIHHFGCTDPEADNYDIDAEIDNGICVFTYSLELHDGANLVSFPILPGDGSIALVMGSLGTNITGVIGEGVGATQLSPGQWAGSLNNISRTSGYWLLMIEDDILTFTGTRTSPNTVYELHEGANLVSWPFTASYEIEPALPDNIETAITGIIGEGTAATQIAPGTWVGSLSSFESGKGYWLKTTMDLELIYESPVLERVAQSGQINDINLNANAPPIGYEFSQSTKQAFYFIESIENIQTGDWILAYNGDEIIGARQWQGSMIDVPAMGSDGSDYTKGYMEVGSVPSFKILRGDELINLEGDIPPWENNQLYMGSSLTEVALPGAFSLNRAYPNPFNPTTTLSFALPVISNVLLEVYDINGRLINELIKMNMDAGYHSVIWNADSQASGVYFVKMLARPSAGGVAGEYIHTQKLMLIK